MRVSVRRNPSGSLDQLPIGLCSCERCPASISNYLAISCNVRDVDPAHRPRTLLYPRNKSDGQVRLLCSRMCLLRSGQDRADTVREYLGEQAKDIGGPLIKVRHVFLHRT